jgi:hypothetical protein
VAAIITPALASTKFRSRSDDEQELRRLAACAQAREMLPQLPAPAVRRLDSVPSRSRRGGQCIQALESQKAFAAAFGIPLTICLDDSIIGRKL